MNDKSIITNDPVFGQKETVITRGDWGGSETTGMVTSDGWGG